MTREFLFAERKSSATQTKGCPFPEEKGDHEVVDEADETYSLSLIIYICVNFKSLHCSPQRRYFCTDEHKSNQKCPFFQESRKK